MKDFLPVLSSFFFKSLNVLLVKHYYIFIQYKRDGYEFDMFLYLSYLLESVSFFAHFFLSGLQSHERSKEPGCLNTKNQFSFLFAFFVKTIVIVL